MLAARGALQLLLQPEAHAALATAVATTDEAQLLALAHGEAAVLDPRQDHARLGPDPYF